MTIGIETKASLKMSDKSLQTNTLLANLLQQRLERKPNNKRVNFFLIQIVSKVSVDTLLRLFIDLCTVRPNIKKI